MINDHFQRIITTPLDPILRSTPFEIFTNWHVITGAPCSGKTTLIRLLEAKGYQTVHEAGRNYIEHEKSCGKTLEEIRKSDIDFSFAIKEITLNVEKGLPPKSTIFSDRAFPDCLAFFRVSGLDPNLILPDCFHHHYSSVFLLDRFPVQFDEARIEDESIAVLIDEWLLRDYSALGYEVIRVPVLSPEERVEFILSRISKAQLNF